MTERMVPTKLAGKTARYIAAVLAIIAGLIHFGIAPEHFEESFEFGVFMLAVGAVQVAAGILLVSRPLPQLIYATIAGTLVVFVIYGVSRTVGLPFGPDPGHAEHVHTIDIVSKITEFVLLLVLIFLGRLLRPVVQLPAPQ